jgi:peroxiredoxin
VAVGSAAPGFRLKDQAGAERSLDELRKAGPVAVVFYRSARWWPFCKAQLVQLQSDLKKIEAAGVTLVAISYDPAEALAEFARQRNITFPLLADPGSKTIEAYGVRDPQGDGIPHPGTFLVDREGVVRVKLAEQGYQTRHTTEALLDAVRGLK